MRPAERCWQPYIWATSDVRSVYAQMDKAEHQWAFVWACSVRVSIGGQVVVCKPKAQTSDCLKVFLCVCLLVLPQYMIITQANVLNLDISGTSVQAYILFARCGQSRSKLA